MHTSFSPLRNRVSQTALPFRNWPRKMIEVDKCCHGQSLEGVREHCPPNYKPRASVEFAPPIGLTGANWPDCPP